MAASNLILLLVFFTQLIISASSEKDLALGWGDHIEWHTLEDGLKISAEQNKPLMFILHKDWCGACKALKPKFSASEEIEKLSQQFVMVNTEDEEESDESKYSPDGHYIPRILFMDSGANIMTDFYNEDGNPKYKYYYPATEHVISTMQRVLESSKSKDVTDEL